jgi:hypothetical protein
MRAIPPSAIAATGRPPPSRRVHSFASQGSPDFGDREACVLRKRDDRVRRWRLAVGEHRDLRAFGP